jgi:hypothetical protein
VNGFLVVMLVILGIVAMVLLMLADVDQLIEKVELDGLWEDEEVGAGDLPWAGSAAGADTIGGAA